MQRVKHVLCCCYWLANKKEKADVYLQHEWQMRPTRGNRARFSWQSRNKYDLIWTKATAFVVVLDFRGKLLSFGAFKQETNIYSWALASNVCTDRVGGICDIYDADKITNVCTSHPPVCHLKLSSSSQSEYFGVMNVDIMSRLSYWFKGWWCIWGSERWAF